MEGPQVAGLIFTVVIILAGVAILLTAMVNRRKVLEMKHRERLAMIERGLVPPPGLDPNGFERRGLGAPAPSRSSARFRSAGVLLIGAGLGLMVILSFAAGQFGAGVGVGGAFALVGAALVLNGILSAGDEAARREDTTRSPAPPHSAGPPTDVAP